MKKMTSRIRILKSCAILLSPISLCFSIWFFIDGNLVYGGIHGVTGISGLICWWLWREILKDLEKMPDRYDQEKKEEENV